VINLCVFRWHRVSFSAVTGSITLFHNNEYIDYVEDTAVIDNQGSVALSDDANAFEVT